MFLGSVYLFRSAVEVEGHRMGGLLRPRKLVYLPTVALWTSYVRSVCMCIYLCVYVFTSVLSCEPKI